MLISPQTASQQDRLFIIIRASAPLTMTSKPCLAEKESDFRPFEFGPHLDGEDITLYRVFDNGSQAPYRIGRGFRAKLFKPRQQDVLFSEVTTGDALHQHLDWRNRHPSPFISLWGSWDAAVNDAKQRLFTPCSIQTPVRRDICG